MKKSLLLLIASASLLLQLSAQQHIKFEKLSVEDGMSQSSIVSIVQDRQGFLWFSTLDGLNKYDGYEFKVYWNSPNKKNAITDNISNVLYETPDDENPTLWIGTAANGLCRYNRITDDFTPYIHDNKNPNSISNNIITTITGDNTTLWVGTYNGLNEFDVKNNKFKVYLPSSAGCSDTILSVIRTAENELRVGTMNGLCVFDTDTKKFTKQCAGEELEKCEINALCMAQDSGLWIGSNKGLWRLDKDNKLTDLTDRIVKLAPDFDLAVQAIHEDKDSCIWIGSRTAGLFRYNPVSQEFKQYKYDSADRFSLSTNGILSIYRDKADILWIGTSLGGINKWNRAAEDLQVFRHNPYDKYSLSAAQVRTFHTDKDTNIWIGTVEGGLNKWDKKTGKFLHYKHDPKNKNSIPHNHVRTICEDSIGNFWIGTDGGGMCYFNRKNNKFTQYKHQKENSNSLPDNHIWNIKHYQKNKLLIASFGGGFSVFDVDSQKFTNYKYRASDETSISSDRVTVILTDKNGDIWIGTFGGLNKWYPDEDKFLRFQYEPDNKNSLSNNRVYSLHQDTEGYIWIGTKGGLNKFDPADKSFKRYTTDNSDLPNNVILGILEDGDYLWVSTNNGISRIHKITEKFKNFDMGDGLQSNEFLANSAHKSPNGELFFGGIDGFNAFKPQSIKDNPHQPSVLITNIEVNNQPLDSDTSVTMLTRIELEYYQNDISFEFVALDFIFPEKNRYAYQLENYDEELNYVNFRRFAKYTNLPPGEYTFRVIGSNNDEVWNTKGRSIKVIIHPAIWQTMWFKISGIMLLILIVIGVYQVRMQNIKRQNKYLEEQVKKRTAEIRQQNEEITAQRDEIEEQKNHIEKHKQEITDSIIYAKRIQTAAMPAPEYLDQNMPEHFILFKPRDIVSGDFYWASKVDNKIIFTAADCTGHGVPGAFMSMLGISFLNQIVNEKKITKPNEILDNLRNHIIKALKQNSGEEDSSKDGMDISLTVIDLDTKKVQFAGAFNPIYIVKNGEATVIDADRMPVAIYDHIEPFSMKEIDISDADMVYMFSDGYPDQFGGPKDKKFMKSRFRRLLTQIAEKDMLTQHDILDNTIEDWRGNEPQIDDIVVVGIRINQLKK